MSSWQNITKLVRKIAHPVIVMDDDDTFVVMQLESYDKLLSDKSDISDLSEEDFLQQINRQIALWRSSQDSNEQAEFDDIKGKRLTGDLDEARGSDEDTFYIEPVV